MILFLVSIFSSVLSYIKIKLYELRLEFIIEDTYWKPDVVDQQEVLVKVMDTYGKVKKNTKFKL